MSADISDAHATTHQLYVIEVVQKPLACAGMVVHQKPCMKVVIIQVTATATKVTIHGVGAAKAAIQ